MATFQLNSVIKIGNYKPFVGVHSVDIKKSIRTYMDTAVIELPGVCILKKTKSDDKDSGSGSEDVTQVASVFKRGDKVVINLGYDGQMKVEFKGYVSRVNKTTPCQIECQGYAFELHSKKINKVFKNTSLKDVLNYIVYGTNIVLGDVPSAPMSKCLLLGQSGISALEAVKKMFGGVLFIWMDDNVMNATLSYLDFTESQSAGSPDVVYQIGWNTIRDDQMKEHLAGDQPVEVVVEQRQKDGSYKRESVGVKLAYQERRRLQSIDDATTQKKIATALEDRHNYQGFEGKITTFLQPFCKPAYKGQIIDKRYQERSGTYLVEAVNVKYSRSGARRILDLSRQLS